MKKKILMIIMMMILLVGCKDKNKEKKPDNLDIAKILLANERLDEDDILEDSLFSSGKKAFNKIKNAVDKYSSKNVNHQVRSKINKIGTKYTWSDSEEYSNFLSYFESYSDSIEYNAKEGSNLIDIAKSSIQTIDTWVKINGNQKLLLTVDKDSEMIISQSHNQYEICRRYQNELGQNTFEMYIENKETNAKNRMSYIPNLRYEFTLIQNEVMFVVIADKDKGYWDIMSTSYNPYYDENYMVFSDLIIKEEAIYEMTYIVENNIEGKINAYCGDIKLISSDGKCDMLSIYDNSVSIFTTGINNLDCFYIYASDDEVGNVENVTDEGKYKILYNGKGNDRKYFTDGYSEVIAKFSNGKELKKGDKLYNDSVEIYGTSIHPIGDIDFYGEINLIFEKNDDEFIFDNLSKLLNDYNFSFKDDIEVIKKSIEYAKDNSANFGKYYLWQNNHINNFEDIKKAVKIEEDLIADFGKIYNNYKDKPTIKSNKQWNVNNTYQFSNLNVISYGTVSNTQSSITINDLILEIDDSSLLLNGSDYQISFALGIEKDEKYTNLYFLNFDNPQIKTYEKTKITNNTTKFQLSQTATLQIPILEEGKYTLVAYISTANEGIRVSNPVCVKGNIVEKTINDKEIDADLTNDENNRIIITYAKNAFINLYASGSYNYEELYTILESYAYNYGETMEPILEKENNSNWEKITSDSIISKGKYRMMYFNCNFNTNAYIVIIID